MTLSSGRLAWSPIRLTGALRGGVFAFSLPFDPIDGPWLSERLASGGSLTLSGEASGDYVAGGFDLRLAGELRVYPPGGASGGIVTCTQLDHRVRLERAVSQH